MQANKQTDSKSNRCVVVETLPNTLFRVQLEGQTDPIMAYLAGKMRLSYSSSHRRQSRGRTRAVREAKLESPRL